MTGVAPQGPQAERVEDRAVAPSESLLVFSDVHLGSDLDDCQGIAPRRSTSVDRDLVALIAHYRKVQPKAQRWHIVIAGDFIDFIGMAITPSDGDPLETELNDEERVHGLGGAADHAREKLRRVARRHAEVFAELASFVADGHALTLVHGNHDIELHWDVVQDDFRRALLEHARAAQPTMDEDAFLARIGFNPWFFWRDGVAFIEHGHQYDPFCATEHVMSPVSALDPRRITRGFCDVLLRYVVRPTRGMSESGHEHVGLTYYLRFGANLGLKGMVALGLRFGSAVRELFRIRAVSLSDAARALRSQHEKRVAQLATAKRIGIERLRRLLALQSQPITSTIKGIMASVLLDRIALAVLAMFSLVAIALASVLFHFTPLAALAVLPAWALGHVLLARQRNVDASVQLADRATQLATLFPAAFIVMGHTHIPQTVPAGDATYINVGSWAEHDEENGERAARTHLVIDVTPNGPEARFCRWGPEGPEQLRDS
jgi:UDP-2,3-diacylglucosamine pyrophosphatase LpxH